jgi:hypothetical protein
VAARRGPRCSYLSCCSTTRQQQSVDLRLRLNLHSGLQRAAAQLLREDADAAAFNKDCATAAFRNMPLYWRPAAVPAGTLQHYLYGRGRLCGAPAHRLLPRALGLWELQAAETLPGWVWVSSLTAKLSRVHPGRQRSLGAHLGRPAHSAQSTCTVRYRSAEPSVELSPVTVSCGRGVRLPQIELFTAGLELRAGAMNFGCCALSGCNTCSLICRCRGAGCRPVFSQNVIKFQGDAPCQQAYADWSEPLRHNVGGCAGVATDAALRCIFTNCEAYNCCTAQCAGRLIGYLRTTRSEPLGLQTQSLLLVWPCRH